MMTKQFLSVNKNLVSFSLFLMAALTAALIIIVSIPDTIDSEIVITYESIFTEKQENCFPFNGFIPEIITELPTHDSVIALTFDACESVTPAYFDTALLNYIILNRLPSTLFIGGQFAERNHQQIRALSEKPFIEIENHSYSHVQHMERLPLTEVFQDVEKTREKLDSLSPSRTRFFRFPGGNFDLKSLMAVNQMMYRTVHWTFPSGDADSNIPEQRIIDWNVSKARPGSILIFHINGRGYRTKHTLPVIVNELKKRGYRFVLLRDYL